jgi:signal transduction histidine kinase
MRQSPPPDEALRSKLSELYEETDSISSDIHHISHELHPAVLERLGLGPALHQYCDEFSCHRKILVHLSVGQEGVALDKEAALALFRVVQECLTNIAKHSGVESCTVKVERVRDRIRLTVSDEGKGFELSESKDRAGLGLESMRERLRSVGGTLCINSRPYHGTSVQAEIPVAQQPAEQPDIGCEIRTYAGVLERKNDAKRFGRRRAAS